jgi:hypothetical protein
MKSRQTHGGLNGFVQNMDLIGNDEDDGNEDGMTYVDRLTTNDSLPFFIWRLPLMLFMVSL